MKKIIITLILAISLISCSQQENNEKTLDNKVEKEKVQKANVLQEKKDIKEEKEKIETAEKVEENKEKEVKKIREIKKHSNGNIYLYENGKEIDFLTNKAGKTWDKEKFPVGTIEYNILASKGKYGIVDKWFNSNEQVGWNVYYVINLNNTQESYNMKEIKNIVSGEFYKIEGKELLFKIDNLNVVNNENEMEYPGMVIKNDIIKEGFKKQGNIWVKKIDLSKIVPDISNKNQTIKKKVKKTLNNNTIKSGKYYHNNLIKEGYKYKTLGDINEYYKVVYHDEVSEKMKDGTYITVSRGYSENRTIYIKGNKILDFSSLLNGGSYINIYEPQINKIGANAHDISNILFDATQPVFGATIDKIIITDLDTIKLVSKEKGINKIIWKRGKGFLE